METKKKIKKVAKVPANTERYIKIVFTDNGVGVEGNYVSSMNHIEAIVALIYSLSQSCPGMSTCNTALSAIDFHRDFTKRQDQMAETLHKLRDALVEARNKAEKKVAKTKKKAVKKTTKRK